MSTCIHRDGHDLLFEDIDGRAAKMSCKRTGCGFFTYTGCTVIRMFEVTHSTLNLATSKVTQDATSEILTQSCDKPLFGDRERRTGVCNSCHKGWEAQTNVFASSEERARAKSAV